MALVQSVEKGYEMLQLIISFLPLPVQAFLGLLFAVYSINFMTAIIKWFLGG